MHQLRLKLNELVFVYLVIENGSMNCFHRVHLELVSSLVNTEIVNKTILGLECIYFMSLPGRMPYQKSCLGNIHEHPL